MTFFSFKFPPLKSRGFGIVEIVVATAIISGTLYALTGVAQFAFRIISQTSFRAQAELLAEEGIEAVKSLRDKSWATNIEPLTLGAEYDVLFGTSTQTWVLSSSTPVLIDSRFTRAITFGDVYRRNSDDDIVDSSSGDPKTLDPDTNLVTSRVSWGEEEKGEEESVSFEGGTTDGNLASFPSNNAGDGDPAQSFTTSATGTIVVSSVDLSLKRTGTPSNVYLEIRSVSSVGTVLATSDTIVAGTIPTTSLTWTHFTFQTPPTLNPSTEYFLRLRSTPDSTVAFSGSSGTINWGYRQTGSSPYPDGVARRYVGRLSNPSDQGQALTQYDFSFLVYKEVSEAGSESVEVKTYITNLFDN